MSSTSAQSIFDSQNIVGESIVWDERTESLVWIDIVGKAIHRLHQATGKHETWATPGFVTALGLRQGGGAIVSLTKDVFLWNFGGDFKFLARIEPDWPGNRINECVVAPDGSFWVGTMQNNISEDGSPVEMDAKSGAYYRVDSRGGITKLAENIYGITNTMVWTGDGRFITADTTANQIYAFRYDQELKTICDRSAFGPAFERGLPDGSCMDAEGYIWNCRVLGGSCLARFAPDGQIDRTVELPCTSPTSCAFGGSDFRTLFVTSARFGMDPVHLEHHPYEGNLWSVDVGVRGNPSNRFR